MDYIFLEVSLAYHSFIMFRNGVKSLSTCFSLSIPFVDSDKPYSFFFKKYFGVKTYFEVISIKSTHIFNYHSRYFVFFYCFYHLLKSLSIKVLAYLVFLGLPFMISLSVSVKRMLFSNFSSTYGFISFELPHEAFCKVPFLIYGRFFVKHFHF